jgi:hypothetical protein
MRAKPIVAGPAVVAGRRFAVDVAVPRPLRLGGAPLARMIRPMGHAAPDHPIVVGVTLAPVMVGAQGDGFGIVKRLVPRSIRQP